MPVHPAPPFDLWQWLQAWNQTWLAGVDPAVQGRRLREHRLAALIATARRDAPFYARRAPHAQALADFEPVSKATLMAHFDDWATDRRITRRAADAALARTDAVADGWLDRYLLWTSSGTSGVPGIFVQDAASLAAYDAIDALRLRGSDPVAPTLGWWGLGRRFAYVGAIGGPYAGHVGLARLRRLVPAPWAPRIDMLSVLEPLDTVATQLQALQPDVLITYPSVASALAPWQATGRLRLRLSELWLGGEQLTPGRRETAAAAFGCPVRNDYGASEFASMAFECSHGRLHLNDDWVVLEGVDAAGCAVPAGSFSHHSLLTNLANRTQPLLRYELTDRVRFVASACPCGSGFPVIEVQGRSDDVLELPALHGGTAALLPLVLETVLEEEARVTEFQLLHHADGRLELRLSDAEDAAAFARCGHALHRCLRRHGVQPVRIVPGQAAPLRQAGSGKLRRVVDLAPAHALP